MMKVALILVKLGYKTDVSTLTNLNNLNNDERLRLMRSAFLSSQSYVFPVTVQHFKYDWLQQYPWLCYSPIEDGAYYFYCVLFTNKSSSRDVQLVHIPCCKWPDAQGCFKRHTKANGIRKEFMEIYENFLRELSRKQEPVNMQVTKLRKNVKKTKMCSYQ